MTGMIMMTNDETRKGDDTPINDITVPSTRSAHDSSTHAMCEPLYAVFAKDLTVEILMLS
jgi:hypothetical protein